MLDRALLILFMLAGPAAAQQEVWVDPSLGSDAAAGTSPADPVRSITHALSPGVGAGVVHLMPGTYAASGGEVFPIRIPADVTVRAVEGRDQTVIRGRPDGAAGNGLVLSLARGSVLEGVTLRGPGTTWLVTSYELGPSSSLVPGTLIDCRLEGSRHALGLSPRLVIERSELVGQLDDVIEPSNDARVTLVDSVVRDGDRDVYSHRYFWYDIWVDVQLEFVRCSLLGGRHVIDVSNDSGIGTVEIQFEDCLIAGNSGSVIDFGATQGTDRVDLNRCTVVDNGAVGVATFYPDLVHVRSSIVAGHAAGDVAGPVDVTDSLIEDATAPAGPGILSGDPGFVDRSAGDFRLRFDSPCVDVAPWSPGTPDRNGWTRTVDGDLDLAPGADLGALEHRTLVAPAEVAMGGAFPVGVSGPAGGFSTVVIAPLGYAPFGASTPFGRLFLDPVGSIRATPIPTTGGAANEVDLGALLDPAWAGTTIGLQALARNTAAPAGGAFSNPLEVRVLP